MVELGELQTIEEIANAAVAENELLEAEVEDLKTENDALKQEVESLKKK